MNGGITEATLANPGQVGIEKDFLLDSSIKNLRIDRAEGESYDYYSDEGIWQ